MRFADQLPSRSGRRPGPVLSYPVFSYASKSPAFLARRFAAGKPHSGSRRIALAWGVRTSVTRDLNSSISLSPTAEPFSFASDFCSEPRWSMAAAAITPRLSDTRCKPASFPGVNFIAPPDECSGMYRPTERGRLNIVIRQRDLDEFAGLSKLQP